MTEEEAKKELFRLYETLKPDEDEDDWVKHHLQVIRMKNKGYWVLPEAKEYIEKLNEKIL